jgi:hypothetical protein
MPASSNQPAFAINVTNRGGHFFASYTGQGLLDKYRRERYHLLLNKRLHLFPPFLSNEPGTEYCPID